MPCNKRPFDCMWLRFKTLALLLLACRLCSSSSPSVRPTDAKSFPLVGVTPDPFVSAAPLIVAAVCSDGVVLVAVHTAFANEPLLLYDEKDDTVISTTFGDDNEKSNQTTTTSTSTGTTTLRDLPKGYRGPFRIHSVDGFGTGLVCCGWRADSNILTQFCRSVASEEFDTFGAPRPNIDHGNYLASEVSLWMANCAVSERVRALSCVALLASCGEAKEPGYLWLVDATGAFRVRAHAVGGGTIAATLNNRLETIDLSNCNEEEASHKIVELLSILEELPAESRAEIATVGWGPSGKQRMQRLFSSRLFGIGLQSL